MLDGTEWNHGKHKEFNMATGVCGETGASALLRPGLEWGIDQEPVQTQSPGGEGGRAWATPCNTNLVVLDLKVRIYSTYFTLQSLDTYVISKNVKEVKCTSDFVIFLLSIALHHYFLDMRYCPEVRGQGGWRFQANIQPS